MIAIRVMPKISPRNSAYRKARLGWLLSAPSILVMGALTVVPMVSMIVTALSASGLQKLGDLATLPSFAQMIGNTIVWLVIGSVGSMVFGFGAALAIQHSAIRLKGLWRSLLILPWITPSVVAATDWKWLYSRDYGILNALLLQIGAIPEPISWLTDTRVALVAVAMVHVWATFPFVMLMLSAGLQAVPDELYEAARLDGANRRQAFWNITVPSLRDIVFIVGLIVTVWTFNSFVPIWIITGGGPAGATNILSVQLYQAFLLGDYSTISIIAVIQLLFSLALAAVYVQRTRKAEQL